MANIEKLIQLNVEIEGLLHVLAQRQGDHINRLLKSKFEEYKEAFELFLKNTGEDTVIENNPLSNDVDDCYDEIIEKETEFIHSLGQEEAKLQEAETDEIDDEMDLATEAIESESFIQEASRFDEQTQTEVQEENHDDNEIIHVELGELIEEQKDVSQEHHTENKLSEDNNVEDNTDIVPETNNHEISVDEMLSRQGAVDLKKVFTLNDKFRFRRALFNFDDEKFAEALNFLSTISTFDEAYRYLIDKYGWDPENEDVTDFMTIIKPHFTK